MPAQAQPDDLPFSIRLQTHRQIIPLTLGTNPTLIFHFKTFQYSYGLYVNYRDRYFPTQKRNSHASQNPGVLLVVVVVLIFIYRDLLMYAIGQGYGQLKIVYEAAGGNLYERPGISGFPSKPSSA